MFPGNPNPFVQPPGKIVLDVQRKRMPSGQIVEIRTAEVTLMEHGLLRKEKVHEVDPPMADGTTPNQVGEIRECHVCLGLFYKDNVQMCPACGHDYCKFRVCQGELNVPGDGSISMCTPCAQVNNRGLVKRIARRFWRLKD